MATNSIIAWTNYVKQASLTAGSSAFSIINIAQDQGSASTAWQTVAGVITNAAGANFTIAPLTSPVPWDVISIHRTNLTAGATVTVSLYTSPSTLVWSTMLTGPTSGYGQVIACPPASTMADYCVVAIDDSTNPDGFINIPLVFAGAAWRPLGSVSYASTVGRDSQIVETTSRGGSEYPSLYFQRRRWNIQLDSLRVSEAWGYADILSRVSMAGSNCLFVPDTTSTYIEQEAIFGRLKPSQDISFPYGGSDRRRWGATIAERL